MFGFLHRKKKDGRHPNYEFTDEDREEAAEKSSQVRALTKKRNELRHTLKMADLQDEIDEINEALNPRSPQEQQQEQNPWVQLFNMMLGGGRGLGLSGATFQYSQDDGGQQQVATVSSPGGFMPQANPGSIFDSSNITTIINTINSTPISMIKAGAETAIKSKGLDRDKAKNAIKKILEALE